MKPKEKIGRQITVSEMAPHVHSFASGENKVNKIADWLIHWIEMSLAAGSIMAYDRLPTKGDLAFHIGVSLGTMQNVFRYVEDYGLVESRQRLGTFIKSKTGVTVKLTSKRELAMQYIKKYIKKEGLRVGDYIISTRKFALLTGISNATIRTALGALVLEGVLKKVNSTFVVSNTDYDIEMVQVKTLVEKIADKLRVYLTQKCCTGDKLPPNNELASMFDVSVKTIHDAVKLLAREGILYTRRGQYGTIVVDAEKQNDLYSYERIELKIREYIIKNCKIGSKLPSIIELSRLYSVSAKTIKKALDNLSEDGYLTFARGRYGGTFVTDIPQGVNEAYKWLALSSDYVSNT